MTVWWDRGSRLTIKSLSTDDPDYPHGKLTGFHYGCDCGECRTAYNLYRAEWRRETGRTNADKPYEPQKHGRTIGTRSCYRRCHLRPEGAHPQCRDANSEYVNEWKKRRRRENWR